MAMTENQTGIDAATDLLLDEMDDHDGWGPVRPRRSSAPVPLMVDADKLPQAETSKPEPAPNTEASR
jgi:hypothetical protein